MSKSVERINTLWKHLSDKEMSWVMSLLVFDKLIDMVKDSDEFKNHTQSMKARTLQWNIAKVQSAMNIKLKTG